MSREVEIIITHDKYDKRGDLFVEWLIGWARSEYKATVSRLSPGVVGLSIAGEDMFKIFTRLYRLVEVMRKRLGADVAVAVCEGDECIDMSEMYWPMILVHDEDVKRLEEAVHMLKGLIVRERIDDVDVEDHDNFIRISMQCCNVDLQIDEAVWLAKQLLDELYSPLTKLETFSRAGDVISTVFDPLDLSYRPPLDIRHAKEGAHKLTIEWCNIYLTTDEILRLAYKILDIAVFRLKFWKEHGRELAGT